MDQWIVVRADIRRSGGKLFYVGNFVDFSKGY